MAGRARWRDDRDCRGACKVQKVELEKPFTLLNEKKISGQQDIFPSLATAIRQRRPLLVITEDFDGEAPAAYKLHGQLEACVIKAPGFGDNRKSVFGDLAILTGGTVFTAELDIGLKCATPTFLVLPALSLSFLTVRVARRPPKPVQSLLKGARKKLVHVRPAFFVPQDSRAEIDFILFYR